MSEQTPDKLDQEKIEQEEEKIQKKHNEEARRKLLENVSAQITKDLDRYLLYMLLVVSLETFLQRRNEDGSFKTDRTEVENVIVDWTETFRTAVQTLIEKDPEGSRQITTAVLNTIINSTREKLFKMLTIPRTDSEEKKPEDK